MRRIFPQAVVATFLCDRCGRPCSRSRRQDRAVAVRIKRRERSKVMFPEDQRPLPTAWLPDRVATGRWKHIAPETASRSRLEKFDIDTPCRRRYAGHGNPPQHAPQSRTRIAAGRIRFSARGKILRRNSRAQREARHLSPGVHAGVRSPRSLRQHLFAGDYGEPPPQACLGSWVFPAEPASHGNRFRRRPKPASTLFLNCHPRRLASPLSSRREYACLVELSALCRLELLERPAEQPGLSKIEGMHRPTSSSSRNFSRFIETPPLPVPPRSFAATNASCARGAAIYSSSLADYTWFNAVDTQHLQCGLVSNAWKTVRWAGIGEICSQPRLRK